MWLGLGSTQFPQKLDFSIKRVHFEAHIYRNSKEERILRLIYKKSYYKIKEEHILRLIYSKIKEEQIWGSFTKEEKRADLETHQQQVQIGADFEAHLQKW